MYAYLHVYRGPLERVSFPDGSSILVEPGTSAAVAERWLAEHPPPPPPPEPERSPQQLEWDRWNDRLDNALLGARTVERAERMRASFLERDPEPPRPAEPPPEATPAPAPLADPEVTHEDWWLTSFAGEPDPLTQSAGYPYDAVAMRLTRLEESGWTVTQVDTHRVAVHEAQHSSVAVTGAAILLHRAD